MLRLLLILTGLGLVAAIALGFGSGFAMWSGLGAESVRRVLSIYGLATTATAVVLLLAQVLSIRHPAVYVIVGGAVFLAVDVVVWRAYGFMPSVKLLRGGFPPAALMGLFLGPIYRAVALPLPASPRH